MPLYEYLCDKGHQVEHIVHHGEETPHQIECPTCRNTGERTLAEKIPSVWGRYRIKGNNSASNTPKRWKGY